MSKVFYANYYTTGDLVGVTDAIAIVKPDVSKYIKAIPGVFYLINDPVFTGLKMHIYATRDKLATTLIASSTNSWSLATVKAQFIDSTLAYGRKQLYFEFNDPLMIASTNYGIVLTATTYTGTISSHLAWCSDTPDPIYAMSTGYTNNIGQRITLIGRDV